MEEGNRAVEGVRIRYLRDGSGPPIVLLHGYSFNADDWFTSGIAPELAKEYAVYAFDMPYGAKSKSSRFRASPREYAGFLKRLLEAFSLDRPPIVGPSMSGEVLLWYAALGYPTVLPVVVGPVGLDDAELQSALSKYRGPLVSIWGEGDKISPPSIYAPLLRRLVPSANIVVMPNAGHPAYLDRPQEFLDVLRTYLREFNYAT
ncbi:alpha/beta fold hydrolase [Thermoproteus tenax]|uniref:Alpha/beta superfamily hydrolase n=1 Tax=Thermoproteus tenax (strain ATCC 35583 / DSM 2078 / JCM 9277 / NBRC 100435 / Kra 1) TaxID=768679 RepID=G4RP14_THETK|nr:alpha/beta hydrolase [Thermoproteus tenax]CCC81308.1 alpha/beta superfamily hydrolase [Thermoproteus tenax Kra 1]